MSAQDTSRTLEKETMKRVMTRVVPLLIVCYIISYLDRVNVGFAALTMNKDLGFSAAVYGHDPEVRLRYPALAGSDGETVQLHLAPLNH